MTRDDLTSQLFDRPCIITDGKHGTFHGSGTTNDGIAIGIVGIGSGMAVGIDAALTLSDHVLEHIRQGGASPLVVLVDSQSQEMARRDELLGLNEYLAHLAKCLILASRSGHRTIGILYGKAAAGALIATGMATDWLIAVPGAAPSVMDLPSIARVTKLPLKKLEAMAETTAIFAPGVEHLAATGAVTETWNDASELGAKLDALLTRPFEGDVRDQLGAARSGRREAARVARSVAGMVHRVQ